MNYLLGQLKIPKDFTFKQVVSIIDLIEKDYKVKVGIAGIKDLGSTFYKLKLYSNEQSRKLDNRISEKVDFVVDHDLKLFKRVIK